MCDKENTNWVSETIYELVTKQPLTHVAREQLRILNHCREHPFRWWLWDTLRKVLPCINWKAPIDKYKVTGVECHGWEGPCLSNNATRQRQNTRYENDEDNYVTLCPDCMKANQDHWDYMWREYYASVR